jgi:hypothetical protein
MNINHCISGIVGALTVGVSLSFAADSVSLKVKKDGSVYEIMERRISLQELHTLAAAQAQNDKAVSVSIVADKNVPLEVMSKVMNTCREAGVNHFALDIKDEAKEPNKAAEPTSTAVTPPAGAGDRASGARGSP